MQRRNFIEGLFLFLSSTLTSWRFFASCKKPACLPAETEVQAYLAVPVRDEADQRVTVQLTQDYSVSITEFGTKLLRGATVSLVLRLNGVKHCNDLTVWNTYSFKLNTLACKRLALATIRDICQQFELTSDELHTLTNLYAEVESIAMCPEVASSPRPLHGYVVPQVAVFNAFTPE